MGKRVSLKEKQEVVERYLCGEKVESICKDTCYPRSTVYDWIKQYKSGLQNHQVNIKDYKLLKQSMNDKNLSFIFCKMRLVEPMIHCMIGFKQLKIYQLSILYTLCAMHLKSLKELIIIFYCAVKVKTLKRQSAGRS